MKKQNLRTGLNLGKKVISTLENEKVLGGLKIPLSHLTNCETSSCPSVYSCAPMRSCAC
jgi:hypothetical protein